MSANTWLWNAIHDLFETDDGSLPEVRVNYVDTGATKRGYALLRELATKTSPELPSFYSIPNDEENLLSSVPNPVTLVVSRQAHPFHVVLCGIQSRGVTIPDIGVFVFPDQLALDYRMGVEWGSAEVEAFFELLAKLLNLDAQASLSLEDGILPEVEARFQGVWHKYSTGAA